MMMKYLLRIMKKPPSGEKEFDKKNPLIYSSWAPHKIFNIGNNQPVKLTDFIQAIESSLNLKAEKEFLPIQPGDVPATFADIQALKDYVDFQPSTSIHDGISRFIQWYKSYYKIK